MESETSDDRLFHVVVFAAPDDPHDLADVLTDVLGIHPTDAMIHSRLVPGILPDRLSREQADRLAKAVNVLGLHAECVSAEEMPDFGHGEFVHHVQFPEAGLDIFGLRGGLDDCVPWDEIDLVCVGVVPQETTKHYLTNEMTTLSAARRTAPGPLEIPLSAGPELWFIRRNPYHAYRVDHKRMNYEYLGDRKTDSATVNFRIFLDDLLRNAPHTYVTPSTRAFLAHGAERLYYFESTDRLQRYTQFHYLAHQRAAKEAAVSARSTVGSSPSSNSGTSGKSP
jgi:hypothetical protein